MIGWRQDGSVDVYHQTDLHPDPAKYDIAGKGLANIVERELAGATYEVDRFGVQAHYEFLDIHNRAVVIEIRERNPHAQAVRSARADGRFRCRAVGVAVGAIARLLLRQKAPHGG